MSAPIVFRRAFALLTLCLLVSCAKEHAPAPIPEPPSAPSPPAPSPAADPTFVDEDIHESEGANQLFIDTLLRNPDQLLTCLPSTPDQKEVKLSQRKLVNLALAATRGRESPRPGENEQALLMANLEKQNDSLGAELGGALLTLGTAGLLDRQDYLVLDAGDVVVEAKRHVDSRLSVSCTFRDADGAAPILVRIE